MIEMQTKAENFYPRRGYARENEKKKGYFPTNLGSGGGDIVKKKREALNDSHWESTKLESDAKFQVKVGLPRTFRPEGVRRMPRKKNKEVKNSCRK